ncbi:23S rRNA (uracil(1939)-C(5))-methyltransferase RlmD [Lusitaniella coriacea]|uniref:23S rRNA (uracil(1939)-C(5))-methyltransferase RlmD n=1 Tax=Lusitaniella coriacea TaxID=1983105 RepID=UPI003CFB1A58
MWQQGKTIEIEITDVSNSGDGVGHFEGRAVFVPQTVTGDRAIARLVRVKPKYAYGQLLNLLNPSPHRIRPRCIVADKCGGCQWQHISDEYQQHLKQQQIIQAIERIGGFASPPVVPLLFATDALHYRNKATYPLDRNAQGNVRAGYYRQGTHQIVNLNQCPVQDERLNPLLAEIKQDIQDRGWSIYNEKTHQGKLRHLSLRIGRRTGEMLLTLVSANPSLSQVETQAEEWMQRYPLLVGVALNCNPGKTNTIFGEQTRCIAGQTYLSERFGGLEFHLRPETFFQINTEIAEGLLAAIQERLELQGNETVLDAYCGIGTFSLPLAKQVREVIGIEVQESAVEQARENATINAIANATFHAGTVKDKISHLETRPDIVLLDPPRKGCDRAVIETLLEMHPRQIAYISCKPATLARDLKLLCQTGKYQLTHIQPADFFPQTAHVECVAFLQSI